MSERSRVPSDNMEHRRVQIVIATANPDKLRELQELLAGLDIEFVPLHRWPDYQAPEETGATLQENALLKAGAAMRHTGLPAVADDTGLEVEALGGLPGVLTARFAGAHASYADNRRKLLALLEDVPPSRRRATFRTVVALVLPDGESRIAEGVCEGAIAHEERGERGFGYDPVFEVVPTGLTFAEMDTATKHALSHRGKALARMCEILRDLLREGRLSGSIDPEPSRSPPARGKA